MQPKLQGGPGDYVLLNSASFQHKCFLCLPNSAQPTRLRKHTSLCPMAEPTGFAAPILAYPQIMKNLHALVSGSSAIHGFWIEHKVGALSSP